MDSAVGDAIMKDPIAVAPPSLSQRLKSLTQRQQEVLDLLLDGFTNPAIARRLSISIHTVKAHRSKVMSRMQASSFAMLIGMTQGLSMKSTIALHLTEKQPSVTIVGFPPRRRQTLARSLRACYFSTTSVANGQELDAAWEIESTDIAIVSPELDADNEDGWQLAQRILMHSDVGVILLSQRGCSSEDRLRGLKMGADAFFSPPLHMKELCAVIVNLGRRLRK